MDFRLRGNDEVVRGNDEVVRGNDEDVRVNDEDVRGHDRDLSSSCNPIVILAHAGIQDSQPPQTPAPPTQLGP
jgi:hypothetical protein